MAEPETPQVIDAEVEEVGDALDAGALVPAGPPSLAVTPAVQAGELVDRLGVIREAADKAMTEDIDYGKVPGTDKPTLLKPGAEKLSVLFQLDIQIANEKRWEDGGHLTVVSKATAYHAPSGTRLGYGEGICTTREKKYAKRRVDLKCPECNAETVKRSKHEDEFYCWKKIGGCGATFPLDDERIVGQEVGEIDNPNLPDTWNTVVKMAEKRARVDAVLAVTGASALFTQDIEDMQPSGDSPAAAEQRPQPKGFASDKQRGLVERLIREAGTDEQDVAAACDYMRSELSRSDISHTIDLLRDEGRRGEVVERLTKAAAKFDEQLEDETQGTPQHDPDDPAHDPSIPF